MSWWKREVYLILLGVAVLTLSLIVIIRNTSKLDIELLAAIGIVGGLAIVVVSLPVRNGNGNGGPRRRGRNGNGNGG